MELRPIFTPTIGTERIKLIESCIRDIENALEQGISVDELIESFNTLTEKIY